MGITGGIYGTEDEKYTALTTKLDEYDTATGFKYTRGVRRLAAIPLSNAHTPVHEASSLPMVGLASAGILCSAYVIRRRCRQAKKEQRDSFGFLPDEERTSLNACEKIV